MINEKESIPKESLHELLFDDWSNDACCGYTLMALRNLQLPEQLIDQILKEMRYLFTDVEVLRARDYFHGSAR
ncbi:hypothetical protein [Hydrogenoanaerobacterium sp.]|uniref:hypothetical protein n=1 Tax=Hydrogenoanaerobacterium sp. TaxID=2953763 RepID=UPI0028A14F41|nr:hypothetical protein [Hydrogenoanaerobacterium sp.]